MKEGLANAPEKLERVARKVMQKQNLHIRKVDMKHFDRDVALVKQIYNAAWQRNWGFTPMTDHEMDHLAAGLKPMIDPNMVFIAETAEGKPVGVALVVARSAPGAQAIRRRALLPVRPAQVHVASASHQPGAPVDHGHGGGISWLGDRLGLLP